MRLIKLFDASGRAVHLTAESISRVIETGPSSQWHGIRSIVRFFDGTAIECNQSAEEVAQMIAKARTNDQVEDFRDRCIDIVARHGGSVEIEAAIRAEPLIVPPRA